MSRFRLAKRLGIPTLTALSLAACATTKPAPPAIELRIEKQLVPVPVPCLAPDQYKALAAREPGRIGSQLTGDAVRDLDTVAASALRLRSYAEELLAAMKACVG